MGIDWILVKFNLQLVITFKTLAKLPGVSSNSNFIEALLICSFVTLLSSLLRIKKRVMLLFTV